MGFFGRLIGWDQQMGAVNAVLASYLIENTSPAERKKIVGEVASIILSVYPRMTLDVALQGLSGRSRVVQMNFIAIACDNLDIAPPIQNNVWTRVENPYALDHQIDEARISWAIGRIEEQDGVRVTWPGNTVRIDFKKMYEVGALH